jgi:hypothetical protein
MEVSSENDVSVWLLKQFIGFILLLGICFHFGTDADAYLPDLLNINLGAHI